MPEHDGQGSQATGPDDPGARPRRQGAGPIHGPGGPLPQDKTLARDEELRGRRPGDRMFNGRYELLRILGRGGMGVVWLAQDKELELAVALKFLPEVMAYNEAAILELKRETRKALQLTHPHIVRIYGWERDANDAAVSMEYVDGRTLATLKAQRPSGHLEVADIREWLRQLCEALDYAHNKARVVHRDLKPANLMVNTKGELKITDFGISRSLEESVSKASRGEVSGTLLYMSPQQLDGRMSEPMDDLYALGATVYELLTGRPPFQGGQLDRQIRETVPPGMAERRRELGVEGGEVIPEAWEAVVAACLAKEPGQRPASAKAVWARLAEHHQDTKSTREKQPENEDSNHGGTESTERDRPEREAWGLPTPAPSGESRRAGEPEAGVPGAGRLEASDTAGWKPTVRKGKWQAVAACLVLVALGAWWLGPGKKGADSSAPSKGASNVVARPTVQVPKASTAQVAQVPAKPEDAKVQREADPKVKASAVRSAAPSFTNGLGMVFVPVPGTGVLFSIWETQVKDFAAFARDSANNGGWDYRSGREPFVLKSDGWKQRGWEYGWDKPGFEQAPEHPVTCVSWDDAVAFCRWLTETERKARRLGAGQEYRLPTDAEWSYAVGIGHREGRGTPKDKNMKLIDAYPWGTGSREPSGAGNYASSWRVDSFERTSPAGSFKANQHGLFDLGGNVWEWCQDYYNGQSGARVLRGASWYDGFFGDYLLSSARNRNVPGNRYDSYGFRVVLAGGGSSPATGQVDRTPARAEPEQQPVEGLKSLGNDAGTVMTNSIGMELVWIAPGKFTMGSPASEMGRDNDEGPQTEVTLTKGYWLGKYEVTQGEYQAVMGSNPSGFKGARLPVEAVSWTDAVEFCRKLTERQRRAGKLPAGYEFRLPTEAQWEYACRAGTTTRFSSGDGDSQLGDAGWYSGNSGSQTHPVGQKQPNAWGLYDLHGNVREWCADWSGTYPGGSVTDPTGASSGSLHVSRGGSCINDAWGCWSADRDGYGPGIRKSRLGFRAALVAVSSTSEDSRAERPSKTDERGVVAVPQPGQPYENGLGMKFVPVPGTQVLFSIWETRVKDYAAYAAATNGVDRSWKSPGFAQGDTHPVVNVSWEEAVAFCRWLTETERRTGRLRAGPEYRLPTDAEWSYAVGIGDPESGSTPKDMNAKLKDVYPWGTGWPPPGGAGNYASSLGVDNFENTSPAGRFKANAYGLFDMGGNVWEWCQDWYDGEQKYRVKRGASWGDNAADYLLSSYRIDLTPDSRSDHIGFRVVLTGGPAREMKEPATSPPGQNAKAASLYVQMCAKCHGADGKGETRMGRKLGVKDYTNPDVRNRLSLERGVKAIKDGVRYQERLVMKPFDDLTDEDIRALVNYMRNF